MIRFVYPDEENRETLLSLCPENERGEIARSLVLDLIGEEEYDIAVCFCYGTFVVRRFYEIYEFTYPLALEEDADVEGALSAIEEYCKRYEFPLTYGDLTDEEQMTLSRRYRHTRTEEFDISEEGEMPQMIYRLSVLTPVDLLDVPPTIGDDEITIDVLTEEDIPSYATLCRDEEILAVWGVDYRDINPDMTDRDFFEDALDEFERGVSITLAVRVRGRFVGEVVFYGFDGKGGAEFSIRLLRGYRRNGYARRALILMFRMAREELMLDFLDGICLKENIPSKCLLASLMTLQEETEDKLRYRKWLV